jgi:hypothetical protein
MPLADQYTGVMNGFGKSQLEDLGLQSSLQEILDFERKDVIQFHARFVKHTNTHETANQGVSFKKTTGVSFWMSALAQYCANTLKSKKFTSGTTDLGERELHSPA